MEEKLKQEPSVCLKVVMFGPESTGKTTLAKRLAEHYKTHWVPEYMREYLQHKWDAERKLCEPNDLIKIAKGQIAAENKLTKEVSSLLVCDTDLLELKVYSEIYYHGYCNPDLLKHALNNWYDIYFLTNIDVPWEADDLRDKPNDREFMFKKFKSTLKLYNKPYIILEGNEDERFVTAVNKIDQLLNLRN